MKVQSPPAGHEKFKSDSVQSIREKNPVHGQSYVEPNRKSIPGRRHMYQKKNEQYPQKSKNDHGHKTQNKKHKTSTKLKINLPQQKSRESGSYPKNTINHLSKTKQKLDSTSKSPPQAPCKPTSYAKRLPSQQHHKHCEPEEEKRTHPQGQHQESPGGERTTRHSSRQRARDAVVKPTTTEGEVTRSRSSPDRSLQHEQNPPTI